MRANFCRINDKQYSATFGGRFWKVFPFRFSVVLNVVESNEESVTLRGSTFLGRLFGTFYLPEKAGVPEQPERLGHPDGLADESNYIKLLLAPLGLYKPLAAFRRA